MLLIVGFLVFVFIYSVVSIVSGLMPISLIDLPAALIVIVPLLFFLPASKSGKIIGRYIKASFTKDHTYTGSELSGLVAAVKNTIKFILGTGGMGFLVGIIAMLKNLENRALLGPNMAISLITVFYSLAISFFIFFPTQAWAENKLNTLKGE